MLHGIGCGACWRREVTDHGDGDGVGACCGRVSDRDAADREDDCEDDEDDLRDVDAIFPAFIEGED